MAMERCFQIGTSNHTILQQTCPRFTLNNSLKAFMKCCAQNIFNYRCPNRSHLVCKYSINEVEVVTACSWTELVVASDIPVLVEFWAPGCDQCQMITSIIDELAKEYAGKILCYKINIDDYPNVATQYGITSIPSMLIYKNGENKECVTGVVPKSTLCVTLDRYVE